MGIKCAICNKLHKLRRLHAGCAQFVRSLPVKKIWYRLTRQVAKCPHLRANCANCKQTVPTTSHLGHWKVTHFCWCKGLLNGKALGPNSIPNEVFKVIALVMAKDLVKAASYCFTNGIILESLKESITVVLRKEGKRDYSLLNSYRPITLENTLAKVLEKYIANIILEAAEKYGLLPWNQMGGRRKQSTLSAVRLLSSCVQTAW